MHGLPLQWHRTPPSRCATSPISSASLRRQGRTIHFRYFVADDSAVGRRCPPPIDPIGVALLQVLHSARLVVYWDIASDWLSDYLPLFTERSVVNRGSTAQPGRGWSLMHGLPLQWHRTPPSRCATSPISSASLRGQGRTIHFRYFVADD